MTVNELGTWEAGVSSRLAVTTTSGNCTADWVLGEDSTTVGKLTTVEIGVTIAGLVSTLA